MSEPESIGAAASGRAGERSDAAPDAVALWLGERVVRVPGWWARAEGYRAGETLRPEDAERAETVSAAARGALAAMDRLTARRRPPVEASRGAAGPRERRAGRRAGQGTLRLVIVALLSAGLALTVSQPLLRLLARIFARIAG